MVEKTKLPQRVQIPERMVLPFEIMGTPSLSQFEHKQGFPLIASHAFLQFSSSRIKSSFVTITRPSHTSLGLNWDCSPHKANYSNRKTDDKGVMFRLFELPLLTLFYGVLWRNKCVSLRIFSYQHIA